MTLSRRNVAVGLLTERDLAVLGQGLRRHYPPIHDSDLVELLARLDAAELADLD